MKDGIVIQTGYCSNSKTNGRSYYVIPINWTNLTPRN